MLPRVVSRLTAQLADRRPGWRLDWVGVAFVFAVVLLIGVGVFMNVAG